MPTRSQYGSLPANILGTIWRGGVGATGSETTQHAKSDSCKLTPSRYGTRSWLSDRTEHPARLATRTCSGDAELRWPCSNNAPIPRGLHISNHGDAPEAMCCHASCRAGATKLPVVQSHRRTGQGGRARPGKSDADWRSRRAVEMRRRSRCYASIGLTCPRPRRTTCQSCVNGGARIRRPLPTRSSGSRRRR